MAALGCVTDGEVEYRIVQLVVALRDVFLVTRADNAGLLEAVASFGSEREARGYMASIAERQRLLDVAARPRLHHRARRRASG